MGIVELCPNEKENTTPDESKEVPSFSPSSSVALFQPITPDSTRETGEEQKPRLSNSLSPLSSHFHTNSLDETPKDGVFHSFITGSDKLIETPYRNKYTRQSSFHAVRRCLSFECISDLIRDIGNDDSCNNEASEEGQSLFELVYAAILNSIVSENNELLPKLSSQVSDSDAYRTPDFVPRISEVAETCPGAPLKVKNHRGHIDKDICRKLEF